MDKILLLFLLFQLCICSTEKKWKLDVLLDEEKDNKIELTPGKFTKIYFVLTNLTELTFPFLEEDSYKLSFQDENIISLNEEIILTPKENLVYSTYIGLKCENSISEDQNEYEIKIEVTPNEGKAEDYTIEYNNVTVSINREKLNINLDILLTSMPKNSFNLLQVREEPYNVDEIRIKPTEIEEFDFEDIVIKSFKEREKLYDENSANHGFFFDSPFGLKNPEKQLNENALTLEINLAENKLKNCYKLSTEKINFNIDENIKIPKIDEALKRIIKYSFEDITEKYDRTTNFKIKTRIPVAPIMITCSLEQRLLVPQKETPNESKLIYKNIITKSEDFIIEVNNLEFNSEYFANCEFSDTNYEDNKRNKTNITIGNREDYDIIHQIKTSRELRRSPQCAKLAFAKEKISEFKEVGSSICKYFMKKDEPFKVRDLPTIICEIVEDDEENLTVCVSPSPKYNIDDYIKYSDNYNYNKSLNDFIGFLEEKYSANIVGEIEHDIKLSNSISIKLTDNQKTGAKIELSFDVLSENNQKIQCFFNKYLTIKNSKYSEFESSLILYPKEKNKIEITYDHENTAENTYIIKSLNLKCYNFPNFNYKYESTDYMTMYSYLDVKDISINNEYSIRIFNNTINCNEKENQAEPFCLRNEKIPMNKIIKTELPESINELDDKIEQFSKMTDDAKFYFLKHLIDIYPKDYNITFIKLYFEKSIEILKYISCIDCSKYYYNISNENEKELAKNNYLNCRNKKKNCMVKIIDAYSGVEGKTKDISLVLQMIGDNNVEENIKSILVFLKELANNEDSYEKGWSSSIITLVIRLQEQFDQYWSKIESFLLEQGNYLIYAEEVKREVLLSLFEILTSIPRIIHYEEIDGYLDNRKKTKSGLILDDTSIKVQNAIINLSKKMNLYDLSFNFSGFSYFENILFSSMGNKEAFEINKDINLEINSKSLSSKEGVYSLQIFTFDSPLVTVYPEKNSSDTFNTLNNFIAIRLLNKDGGEIKIKDIPEKNRPKILYPKDKYKDLKGCYYYDEKEHILKYDGISLDDNFDYKNKKYYKCESSHLTIFTAGSEYIEDKIIKDDDEEDSSGLKTWQIILILLGVVVLLTILITVISHFKKRKISSDNIDSNFDKNEGLMREELY